MINQSLKVSVSKKHHYLPRHYLSGFTDTEQGFFVYDKQTCKTFYTNPGGAFFENNLNTVIFPGGKTSDFLESLYTDIENQSWPALNRIKVSTRTTPVALLDKMHLFLFLLFLFWRLPGNIELVEKLAEKAFRGDNEVDYLRLKNKTGGKVPDEIAETIRKSSAFKKSFKQVVPFIPFFKDKNWANKVDGWRFLYTGDEKCWYMVGDNPIIFKNDGANDFINRFKEFVFPVSGKILLLSTEGFVKEVLPPEFAIEYNAAIIEHSQRFVACQDKSFLEAMTKYHQLYVQFGKTDNIVPELFGMLEK